MKSRRRSGYTLLEIVLVLTLLVVLIGLAAPSMQNIYSDLRIEAAADAVRSAWADARTRAVNEGRPYRFSLLEGYGNYRVAPDTSEFWSGSETTPASESSPPPLVLDGTLPKGARFHSMEAMQNGPDSGNGSDSSMAAGSIDPASWSMTLLFLPDGTVRSELELIQIGLRAPGTRPLVVRMRTLTGVARVEPYRPGGGR